MSTTNGPVEGSRLPIYRCRVDSQSHLSMDAVNEPSSYYDIDNVRSPPIIYGETFSSPYPASAAFAASYYHASLQHLDKREQQRRRLVCLFLIPEFFKVVREGWAAAVIEERQKTLA